MRCLIVLELVQVAQRLEYNAKRTGGDTQVRGRRLQLQLESID